MLVGDFNFPNVSWVSGNVVGPKNSVNNSIILQKHFVDGVHNNGLSWSITDETTWQRMVGNTLQKSTIDQGFSSEESFISGQ